MEKTFSKHMQQLKQTIVVLHRDLAKISPQLPFSISEILSDLDTMHRAEDCAQPARSLDVSHFMEQAGKERDALVVEHSRLEQNMDSVTSETHALQTEIDGLRKQSEARPNLPGYDACLNTMRDKMLSPLPFYKGLEWRPGLDRREADRVEESMGPHICATLFLRDDAFEAGREIAAHYPGIRVSSESRGLQELPDWMRNTFDIKKCDPLVLRCVAAEMISDLGPLVARIDGSDILSFRSHDRRLSGISLRLIGEKSRQQALKDQIGALEEKIRELNKTGNTLKRQLQNLQQAIALLDTFRERLGEGLSSVHDHAVRVWETDQGYRQKKELLNVHEKQHHDLQSEIRILSERLDTLGRRIRQEGLHNLDKKVSSLSAKLSRTRKRIDEVNSKQGEIKGAVNVCENEIADLTKEMTATRNARDDFLQQLAVLLPGLQDLPHYILRTKKGFQFKTIDAVQKERETCERTIIEDRTVLKERLNDPEFGAAFRFTYEEEANALFDFRERPLRNIISQQSVEMAEQKEIINDRTKELFKKIIMTELVNYLRTHVSDLDRMMNKIRHLLEKRSFGGQQYRFRIRPLEKFRRLVSVIKKFSPFDPAAEEELRHFFEDHAAEIVNTEVGAIPEELDYRNWYRYEMEVATVGTEGTVMDRRTKSMGSGGEQAVPNYLLVLTIAHFLYNGKQVRLHTLLFDEAFYGIDAGRRDQLLGFATDLDLQLFVASPDQDGVRREISYSTTLLVKKDLNSDVHLFPFHWENPDNVKDVGLFDAPEEEKPVAFGEEL